MASYENQSNGAGLPPQVRFEDRSYYLSKVLTHGADHTLHQSPLPLRSQGSHHAQGA